MEFDKVELEEKIVLDTVEHTIQTNIHKHQLLNASLESTIDYVSQDLIIKLKNRTAYQTIERIKVPKTWVQHLKERMYQSRWLAPKWFQERFPVQYNEYQVDAFYNKISIPKYQPSEVIHKIKDGGNGDD